MASKFEKIRGGFRRIFKKKGKRQPCNEPVAFDHEKEDSDTDSSLENEDMTMDSDEIELDVDNDSGLDACLAINNQSRVLRSHIKRESQRSHIKPESPGPVHQLANRFDNVSMQTGSGDVTMDMDEENVMPSVSHPAVGAQFDSVFPIPSNKAPKYPQLEPRPYRNSNQPGIAPRPRVIPEPVATTSGGGAASQDQSGLSAIVQSTSAQVKFLSDQMIERARFQENIAHALSRDNQGAIKIQELTVILEKEKLKVLKKQTQRVKRLLPKKHKLASAGTSGSRNGAQPPKKYHPIRPQTSDTATAEILRANAGPVFIRATNYKKKVDPKHSRIASMIQDFARDHLEELGQSTEWEWFAGVRPGVTTKRGKWMHGQIFGRLRDDQFSAQTIGENGILAMMALTYNLAVTLI